MQGALDFYYDIGSPYSYIAAARIEDAAQERGVTVRWRPFLLGGVFRAVGNTMPAAVPARAKYMLDDLRRWADALKIPFNFSSSFPHNTLLAMRALSAAKSTELVALSQSLFRAAWVDNLDVSSPDVVAQALGETGPSLIQATQHPEIKERLKTTTQAAIDAGAFGAPSFVVDGALFWGNDRLEQALAAVQRPSKLGA